MRYAVAQKFAQNPTIQALLLDTEDCLLVEDSAKDSYWGRGPSGDGLNKLGHVLMEWREKLRGPAAERQTWVNENFVKFAFRSV
jgi:ribA/ribD-fused uncharacterized protein